MGENAKINEKCIKGNVVYYKIKINEIVNDEINKLGANEEKYQKLNCKISSNFKKFTDKLIAGDDFTTAMVNLRDEVISECVEVDKNVDKSNSSEMRPFFKNYVFDKIYSMGINIKNGAFPEDCNQELEAEKLRIEEENKLKGEEERLKSEEDKEQEEKEQEQKEINIKIENEEEEKQPDLVDQIFSYFFGSSKSTTSDKNKKPEKDNEKEKKVKV